MDKLTVVIIDDDGYRYATGLEFLGVPCRLFLTTTSIIVSFDGYADPTA